MATKSKNNQVNADEATTGVIYILANAAMPAFTKVGTTTDLPGRIKELDRVGAVPFPWVCQYAAEVDNPGAWVRMARDLFSQSKVSTCFFESEVMEQVLGVFKLAKGKEVKLTVGDRKPRTKREPTKKVNGSRKPKSANFDFGMLEIEVGTELQFAGDEGVEAVCSVSQVKPPRVTYGEEVLTLSVAAARVLGRDSTKGLQGPLYWRFEGETLADRRKRMEAATTE